MTRQVEREVDERPRAVGEITIRTFDAEDFQVLPGWDRYPTPLKLRAARLFKPTGEHTYRNTITRGFSELQAKQFDRGTNSPAEASHLAIGTDNSTSPSYDDTALNNEAYRTTVTDSNASGRTLELITFIDSTEANSMDAIREVGVTTGDSDDPDATLLNHSLIDPEPKSSEVAITITVVFTFKK